MAAGATLGAPFTQGTGSPAVHIRHAAGPVAVASANGLQGVELAGRLLVQGMDTLDAAIEGVKTQELDAEDTSVGYGGLPNEEGVVELDASCMHGPTRRLNFYAVNKNGEFGTGTLWSGRRYATFDGETASLRDIPYLYERD